MPKIFPATYSTLSVSALAVDLLPNYAIGEIADCKLYSVGVNDTYQVRTKKGETYFLRVYRSGLRTRAEVEYELDMLEHLHRKGVAVAHPLVDQENRRLLEVDAPEGQRFAVLFTQAVGIEPSYDENPEEMSHRYGQAVARIHNALQDFNSQHIRPHIDLQHLIEIPLVNIQPVLSRRAEDWAYLQQFANAVSQHITALPAGALELGACHGDLQGYHAHIANDGTLTFYDFDFCGSGFRAYDLAVFRWCGRLSDKELVWWEPYLRAYRELRPLADLDLQAVPLFICARHIWHMGLHTGNASDWGYGDLNDAYFDKRLKWLRELEADYL